MDESEIKRLEDNGWNVSYNIEDFLKPTFTIELQWRRTKSDGGLELWVNENNKWVHYKQSKHYVVDPPISSQSGFHTAQKYLKLNAKFIPIEDKDYKVPEEE